MAGGETAGELQYLKIILCWVGSEPQRNMFFFGMFLGDVGLQNPKGGKRMAVSFGG